MQSINAYFIHNKDFSNQFFSKYAQEDKRISYDFNIIHNI